MDNISGMKLLVGIIVGLFVVAAIIVLLIYRLRSHNRKLNTAKFTAKWQDAQKFLSSKETWQLAVINADKLLDEALKKKRYKGKSTGERLVAAQRDLSDNDGVWFGHKLSKKLLQDEISKLRKRDVQDAMIGIRQALRDLGALK